MLILKRVERQKEGRKEAGGGRRRQGEAGGGVSEAGRRGEGDRGQRVKLLHNGKTLPAPGLRKSGVQNTG